MTMLESSRAVSLKVEVRECMEEALWLSGELRMEVEVIRNTKLNRSHITVERYLLVRWILWDTKCKALLIATHLVN